MAHDGKQFHVRLARRIWGPCYEALRSAWRPTLNLALATGLLAPLGGCTRCFFRVQADKEVSEILGQKDKYEAWKIENWHVYPDPLARFAEVGKPDCPAKPPDDPAAYDMSPNPQKPPCAGIQRQEGTGYLNLIAMWDKENRARKAQEAEDERKNDEKEEPALAEPGLDPYRKLPNQNNSPKSNGSGTGDVPVLSEYAPQDAIRQAKERSLLDVSGRPTYLLTLDQAAELAMFNSREYQDEREELYIAALPVTQERFSFSTQLFAASEAMRTYAGGLSPGGPENNWTLNNGTGFAKILPTGALLLLNFSNTTVFDFLSPKKTTSLTSLDFSAVQPLLQGGGYAITLESLTQAERNMLYQIRTYARFRKQLYVEVASNNGGSISGGTFQPANTLSNTSASVGGLGASGIIPGLAPAVSTTIVGAIRPPSSPGFLALSPAISPSPSGYLNTMLEKIQVYIDQENIDVLSDILLRFRGLLDGDIVGPLQVQSVEQQLLAGRATILTDQNQYLTALDSFKLALGLPMQISIEMDDSVLQPLIKQYKRARAVIENEQTAVAAAGTLLDLEKAPRVRAALMDLFLNSTIARGTNFAKTIRARWGEWESLSNMELDARLARLRDENQLLLDRQTDLQREGKLLSRADQARLIEVGSQRDLGSLERAMRQYEAAFLEKGRPKKQDAAGERQRIRMFQTVVSAWQKVLVVARDEQWEKVRATWPELNPCCLEGVDLVNSPLSQAQAIASQYALTHRLDLMNVRAQVVDAWRQLAVYANTLLGVFNVSYNLDATSPALKAQPLNIGGSATSHQLTLQTQLPLVRINQRNNYRASLIAFTRQRRALEEAEDITVQLVYGELYALRLYAEQYKVQKRLLELAYLTIDSSLESLQAPTAPPALPGTTRTAADGPAALTQQLLAAQRTLPTAQNGLLTIWINYLDQRLQLYRDLELMPLDARGVWIDQIKECECPPAKSEKGETSGGAVSGANKAPEAKPGEKPESLPPPTKEPAPQSAPLKRLEAEPPAELLLPPPNVQPMPDIPKGF